MNLSRRNVLQMLGLGGAGYLLPSLGGGANARAAGPAVPRRILFFYTEQGTIKQSFDGKLVMPWTPSAPGAPDAAAITVPWSTRDHTLGELHQPLVPFKNKLTFLDGLDMVSAQADPIGGANGHIGGETHALIAANRQSPELGGGPSIDQYIAKAINSPSPLTSLRSLEMYVNQWGSDGGGEAHPLYESSGQAIPLRGDCGAVYDRMLPNGPKGTTPEQKARLARMVGQQQSVLDFAKGDFSSLSSRLGKRDRERLDSHASAVSDLRSRLALGANVACVQPDRSIVAGTGFDEARSRGEVVYERNADVMMRLAQTALACDLTRVATVYMGVPPDSIFGYREVEKTTGFHDMIHQTNGGNPVLGNNPEAMRIVKNYHSYISSQYAKMLALLDAIPEPDGGTLLDSTLVVWCGQIAAGDHSLDRLPYVIGGGGAMSGAITPGRYVRYPRKIDPGAWYSHGSIGPAHNDLFVSLANAMGVSTNTFGNAQVCKGPLAGLV